jgi:CubicO group peptidase (beta-lactamase class C family)
VLLVFTLFVAACASGPPHPAAGVRPGDTSYLEQRLGYEIDKARQELGLASVAVSVVDEHGPIFERAFGDADKERGVPATIDTPYRWGSNAKLFVMLALLQLEEQGLVDLDAPLTRYLPEFTIGPPPPQHPESASWQLSDITLRRMLTHYSGLPNDYVLGFLSLHPLPLAELPARVKDMHAAFPVDLVHSYSNLAYGLLGLVVQRVSGQSFDAYVRAHLFAPLGMADASFAWTEDLLQRVARPYDGKGQQRPLYRISLVPAGELTASVREMGRFATAMLAHGQGVVGRVVDPSLLQASLLRQDGDIPLAFDAKQALTWRIDALPVETFGHSAQHGGGVLSHHSAFVLLTDHRLGVALVTNSERGAGVVNQLARRALALAIEVKTGRAPRPTTPPVVEERAEFDPGELERWIGSYATPFGDMRVRRDDEQLYFHAFGRRMELKPLAGGGAGIFTDFLGLWDVQPEAFATVRVSLVSVGPRTVVVQTGPGGRRQLIGEKYMPVKATGPWPRRVGVYRLLPRAGDFQFLSGMDLYLGAEGQLAMRPRLTIPLDTVPGSAMLHPVTDTDAVTEGLGRNRGVRISFDGEDTFQMSGLVFQRERAKTGTTKTPRVRHVAPRGGRGVRWHDD